MVEGGPQGRAPKVSQSARALTVHDWRIKRARRVRKFTDPVGDWVVRSEDRATVLAVMQSAMADLTIELRQGLLSEALNERRDQKRPVTRARAREIHLERFGCVRPDIELRSLGAAARTRIEERLVNKFGHLPRYYLHWLQV